MNVTEQLKTGLDAMCIDYTQMQIDACLYLLKQLQVWNKKINLTAITNAQEIVSKHLLDSLAILPYVQKYQQESGTEALAVLDVGTGAGFPSLPLAIFTPEIQYYPLDSNSKKLSFIRRMATQLQLSNIETIHSRIQDLTPDQPYSIVTARAFAEIGDLLEWLPETAVNGDTKILAMKGKLPEAELDRIRDTLLSTLWTLSDISDLYVPGLEAERCLLHIRPTNDA